MLADQGDFFPARLRGTRAISARWSGVSFADRALPPFAPPAFPRATALAFLPCSSGGLGSI
jgi:hypothetical protein